MLLRLETHRSEIALHLKLTLLGPPVNTNGEASAWKEAPPD